MEDKLKDSRKAIKHEFTFFNHNKLNELEYKFDDDIVPMTCMVGLNGYTRKDGRFCVDDKDIEYLHPDNIDNSYFWKKAVELSPSMAIKPSGNTRDKHAINSDSFYKLHNIVSVKYIDEYLAKKPNAKILEIGPGLGVITYYIEQKYNIKNYYGIDIYPHFKHNRVIKCDGSSIPSKVFDKIDFVYSVNVFQHLSAKQRFSYFSAIKERLTDDGEFIVMMFCSHEGNTGLGNNVFNVVNSEGTYLSTFFNQLIEVPSIGQIYSEIDELDLELEVLDKTGNACLFRITK